MIITDWPPRSASWDFVMPSRSATRSEAVLSGLMTEISRSTPRWSKPHATAAVALRRVALAPCVAGELPAHLDPEPPLRVPQPDAAEHRAVRLPFDHPVAVPTEHPVPRMEGHRAPALYAIEHALEIALHLRIGRHGSVRVQILVAPPTHDEPRRLQPRDHTTEPACPSRRAQPLSEARTLDRQVPRPSPRPHAETPRHHR